MASSTDIIFIGGQILGSLGGGAVIVAAFSGWLGKVWAKRILEKEKNEYAKELEKIKGELELQLDIAKSITLRYSENQFSRYDHLWVALCNLKLAGDNLWDQCTKENLSVFAKDLAEAQIKVEHSFLFLEEDHYKELMGLFREFRRFEFGKKRLMEVRSQDSEGPDFSHQAIDATIRGNGEIRDRYVSLVHRLGRQFRNQIKVGGSALL
jgi:hypothetical protein